MSQASLGDQQVQMHPPNLPPVPPTRGLSSYNGVRTGSFASFGHPAQHFGAPMQISNGFSHSHYSVPGMFFHHHLPCCPSAPAPAFDPAQLSGSNGYPEDHYESASICYGSPAASGSARVAGLKPRNYQHRPKGGNFIPPFSST